MGDRRRDDASGRTSGHRQGRVSGSEQDEAPRSLEQQFAFAREIALRRLELRAQSRAELAQALSSKGVPSEVSTSVLDRFETVGLINDEAFAIMWATSRHQHRDLSRRAIRLELRRKGLGEAHVATAVEGIDLESELAAARRVASKKATSLRGLSHETAYRRLAGALGRKGFGSDVLVLVVRETLEELKLGSPCEPSCDG